MTAVPATAPALWVVTDDGELFRQVEILLEQLCGDGTTKRELENVQARMVKPSDVKQEYKRSGPPAAVVFDAGEIVGLVDNLSRMTTSPPLLVLIGEYAAQQIDDIYNTGYLQLQGFFRKRSFSDPEERGVLARTLKEALRQDARIAGATSPKAIGWKIRTSASDDGARRQLSLVLDRRMRSFTQQLSFATERVKAKIDTLPGDGQALAGRYFDLGRALRSDSSSSSQLTKLRKEWKLHFTPPAPARPRPILLQGESGTGKTLVADWVARRLTGQAPVQVSLVNMSSDLLEAELFGTVAGGFTDAVSRPGKLHLAQGRVIFLDEIGDAPLDIQAKLLIYLDHFGFRPVGWPFSESLYSPAYLIAGTNRNLPKMIEEGRFREDLYFRFLHRLELPPLRERLADLRVLIDFVLQDRSINGSGTDSREVEFITIGALEKLERHSFPGNFRELEDVLARAVFNTTRAGRKTILAEDIEFAR